MIKLYNSLTGVKEELKVQNKIVKMYSCGPTVYYLAHIGNMRAYVFMDILRRVLKYNNLKIDGVMNITDVGHLTSDADTGEDKMVQASRKENKSVSEIAAYYTNCFLTDAKRLNIGMPEHIVKATDCIPDMIDFIKGLEVLGYTYVISDGVYFDVSKFNKYGSLSKMKLEDKLEGARVEQNKEKRTSCDFALWKFVEKNHIMKWDSPWGEGCPGWHIECSAMGKKFFNEEIDIHTGGIDHLSVHHENEIAQNDCLANKSVVKIWMHNEFLLVDGGKMSKSLNNIYKVEDLINKGYSPLDFRYFCLNTHYRKKLNFTFVALDAAKTALFRLKQEVESHKGKSESYNKSELVSYKQEFLESINDDLNVTKALSVIWNMLKNLPLNDDIYKLAINMDSVLGLDLSVNEKINQVIPDEVITLAKKREIARANKDFAMSDTLRSDILNLGYIIKDTANGFELVKK